MRVLLLTSLLAGAVVACSDDNGSSALNAGKPGQPAEKINEPPRDAFQPHEVFTCSSEDASESYKFEINYTKLDKTRLSIKRASDQDFKLVDKNAKTVLRHQGFPGAGLVVGLDVSARTTPDFSERCFDMVTVYEFGLRSNIGALGDAEGVVMVRRYIDVDPAAVCSAPIARPSTLEYELTCNSVVSPSDI